ncbi:MAG TPA: HupE/UreJ family protein [Hyphomicrobiaceae bacterium]|nr:HupE/UreJ family protein [Hyphomicrobiaceae bacterium]
MTPRTTLCWLLAALCLAFGPAIAHKAGTTGYATITVAGQSVRFALTLPQEGVLPDGPQQELIDFAAAIAAHVRILADGSACAGVPAAARRSSPGRANIEIVVLYACAAPVRILSIRDGLAAVLGEDHHTIADIGWPGGSQQVVFETGHRAADVSIAGAAPADSPAGNTFASYFFIGVEHILTGFDHVLFIIALILPGGRWLSLAALVTAFTVAHSLTLALSVLGIATLPAQLVEPVIALSIAYVAFENLTMKRAVSRRWLVSFLFGLVHGFGFAGALAEVGLPTGGLVSALVGFNLGVEAGQLLIVGLLLPLLLWLQRFPWEPKVARLSSTVIMAAGLALLVERALIGNM